MFSKVKETYISEFFLLKKLTFMSELFQTQKLIKWQKSSGQRNLCQNSFRKSGLPLNRKMEIA